MRLWLRLAVVMALLSTVPLLFVGWRSIQVATDEATRTSRELLQRDAETVASFVDAWLVSQSEGLRGWMRLYALEGQPPEVLESLQRSVWVAVSEAAVVALVDSDGVPLVEPTYLSSTPTRPDFARREVATEERVSELIERIPLTEALSGGRRSEVVFGMPYLPPGAQFPSVPVAVTGPTGEPIVLGVELSLAWVVELVRRHSVSPRGMALLTQGGQDVLGLGDPLVDAQRVLPLLGTAASVTLENADQRSIRVEIMPLATVAWAMVVVEPVEVAERAGRQIRGRTGKVLVAAIVLALIVGTLMARNLSQPVGRLRDVAMSVAEGEYGLRVDEDRRDEIGELARAFNHMSERLRENARALRRQHAEIEAFNRELQLRVEDRTRELRQAQDRLVRSSQLAAVAEVGAGLAHELNNPLAGILGLAQVLRYDLDGTTAEQSLDSIVEQAERCRQVVSGMLRLSAGEVLPAEASVIDLRTIVDEVVQIVEGPFRHRGVSLQLEQADVSLPVSLHPVYGSRMLAQILSAFRSGLPEGSTLRVLSARVGDEAAVTLDPDAPVAMGDARDDWMASGMGLWVARHLLDELGGRLEEPLAGQTRWRILLPLAAEGVGS